MGPVFGMVEHMADDGPDRDDKCLMCRWRQPALFLPAVLRIAFALYDTDRFQIFRHSVERSLRYLGDALASAGLPVSRFEKRRTDFVAKRREGGNQGFLDFASPSPILSEHGVISQRGQANGWGDDVSNLTFTNAANAAINVNATASVASASGNAAARNVAAGLVVQKTQSNGTGNDTVTAALTNAGRIGITAGSTSTAAAGNALAVTAVARAIQQTAEATGPTKFAITSGDGGGEPTFGFYNNIGELAFTNAATGVIEVRATASAAATGGAGQAHAYVDPGMLQAGQVDGGTPKARFDNRKTFTVSATSVASGASAFATAGTANLLVDAGFPVDEGRLPALPMSWASARSWSARPAMRVSPIPAT